MTIRSKISISRASFSAFSIPAPRKDVNKNELYVSNTNDSYWLESDSCLVNEINLFKDFEDGFKCNAKFRYRQQDNPVTLYKQGDAILVKFDNLIKAITPGQQAVFYDGDVVIGGGVIDQAYRDNKSLKTRLDESLDGK